MKQHIRQLINECIESAVELKLIRRPKSFQRVLAIRFHNGCISRGGGNELKAARLAFAMNGEDFKSDARIFREYKRHNKSKFIGGFTTNNSLDCRKALIAHELAHAIQFWNGNPGKAHGKEWRKIYHAIREHWVNPYINTIRIKAPINKGIPALNQYLKFTDC